MMTTWVEELMVFAPTPLPQSPTQKTALPAAEPFPLKGRGYLERGMVAVALPGDNANE